MTLAIQKFHKTYNNREIYNFEYTFEAYYYDKFFRFLEKIPFTKLMETLSAGTSSESGLIYLSAGLYNPKVRKVESVKSIQMLSFYIRPGEFAANTMIRIQQCPNILFAGYTINGGLRWSVPISVNVPGFSSLPPIKKSQVFANAYKKGLAYYRSEFSIAGIKPTSDLMECLNPLQPDSFFDNSRNYQILHF